MGGVGTELVLGGAPARLLLQDCVDRGELALHGADLVFGLPELVVAPPGLGSERDTGDGRDHAGDAGHDPEHGRAGRDAYGAGGERGQPA